MILKMQTLIYDYIFQELGKGKKLIKVAWGLYTNCHVILHECTMILKIKLCHDTTFFRDANGKINKKWPCGLFSNGYDCMT